MLRHRRQWCCASRLSRRWRGQSCLRKPERDIYQLALETTQVPAEQCCFIDDRALNLECAAHLGMKTIEMKGVEPLRAELGKLRVEV